MHYMSVISKNHIQQCEHTGLDFNCSQGCDSVKFIRGQVGVFSLTCGSFTL